MGISAVEGGGEGEEKSMAERGKYISGDANVLC